ncbi:MAG: hypothetical protein IPQ22_17000 [Rhodoferax sp.]|nr:hypothetical protein [Rhodoferax sp.]
MKIRRGGVWAAVLAIAATLLLAAPAQAEEVMEPPAVEVIPDQPEWEYEWRDREYTVVCDGENSARIVIQSMWRPSEPTWNGAEWVTYDDWAEWAWPEAMQTVYKPIEPGDCETVPGEAPASTHPPTQTATRWCSQKPGLRYSHSPPQVSDSLPQVSDSSPPESSSPHGHDAPHDHRKAGRMTDMEPPGW